MSIQYKYVAFFRVNNFNLKSSENDMVLVEDEELKFIFTKNPTKYLKHFFRKRAVTQSLFQGGLESKTIEDIEYASSSMRADFASDKKNQSRCYLVCIKSGEVDYKFAGPCVHYESFSVYLDSSSNGIFEQTIGAEVDRMSLILSVLAKDLIIRENYNEFGYFIDSKNKPIYCISFSINSHGLVISKLLNADRSSVISASYNILKENSELNSVARLISQAVSFRNDNLKAFIFAWSAMEIFVNKAYKKVDDDFLKSTDIDASEPFFIILERGRRLINEKNNLVDKFALLSCAIFSNLTKKEITKNIEEFTRIKKLRNNIYHGSDFDEHKLPVNSLISLFSKYFFSYLKLLDK